MADKNSQRNHRREQLMQYYGGDGDDPKGNTKPQKAELVSQSVESNTKRQKDESNSSKFKATNDPYDMDSTSFDPDLEKITIFNFFTRLKRWG